MKKEFTKSPLLTNQILLQTVARPQSPMLVKREGSGARNAWWELLFCHFLTLQPQASCHVSVLHWPVNLPSQAVVRMKWVNAQWEESDHSVRVRGVIGGGNAHGISYSTSIHYLKDLIAPCFGDAKVRVMLKFRCPAKLNDIPKMPQPVRWWS